MSKRTVKMLALVIAAICCLQGTLPTYAAEYNEPATYVTEDGIVVDAQVDPAQVDDMPKSMRWALLNEDCTLVSVNSYFVDVESNTQSRAAIPTSDLKLTISVSRLDEEAMALDNVSGDAFIFVGTAEWLVNPLWELTDCIAMSWSDNFTLYFDYGFVFNGEYNNGNQVVYPAQMTLNAVDNEKGFAYDVDLLVGETQKEITIIGKVFQNDSSGTANVTLAYGHVKVVASSITVGFSAGVDGSVSISMSTTFGLAVQMASPAYTWFSY